MLVRMLRTHSINILSNSNNNLVVVVVVFIHLSNRILLLEHGDSVYIHYLMTNNECSHMYIFHLHRNTRQ